MPKNTTKKFVGPAGSFVQMMKQAFIGQGANPNDIIVQDLYSYNPPQTNNGGSIKGLFNSKSNVLDEMRAMSAPDRAILQSILAIYNEHIDTKRDILAQARNLFDTDVIQTLVEVLIDDGFNSFQNEKDEFKIEYILDDEDLQNLGEEYQKQVQNVFDEFVDKFSLKTKVAEIVPDLIRDGEYAFGVLFKDGKGITNIIDDLDVINLLPFYENDKLAFVINQNHFDDSNKTTIGTMTMEQEKPVAYKPDNIVFFRLQNTTKLRINMSLFYDTEFRRNFLAKTGLKLPKYIRSALPLYYGAIKTLNRIKIMDNVATVLDLNDILKPEIVHVSVPAMANSKDANQIVANYERHLNDIESAGLDESCDFATLAAMANRRKVLPVWLDNKGSLSSAGINQSSKSQGAWDAVDRLRNLAAVQMGIPPFYLNITGTPIEKAQIIKLYSRYTRKLTALQNTLANGIKDFLMIHCKYKGLNISRDNISIKFKALTSGDCLDDTDLMCAVVTSMGDLYKALDEITSSDNNYLVLDDEQFKQLFNDITSRYLNISNLIRYDKNKFNAPVGEGGGDGFESLGGPSGDHGLDMGGEGPDSFDMGGNNSVPDSQSAEATYDDFVDATNDISVPGTEPAIEDI